MVIVLFEMESFYGYIGVIMSAYLVFFIYISYLRHAAKMSKYESDIETEYDYMKKVY